MISVAVSTWAMSGMQPKYENMSHVPFVSAMSTMSTPVGSMTAQHSEPVPATSSALQGQPMKDQRAMQQCHWLHWLHWLLTFHFGPPSAKIQDLLSLYTVIDFQEDEGHVSCLQSAFWLPETVVDWPNWYLWWTKTKPLMTCHPSSLLPLPSTQIQLWTPTKKPRPAIGFRISFGV